MRLVVVVALSPQGYKEEQLPSESRLQLLRAMHESGINEPTASELADLPHVTEEYVRAHVRGALAEHLRVGAAIERMRLGAPVPHAPPEPRSRREEAREKMRRFMES